MPKGAPLCITIYIFKNKIQMFVKRKKTVTKVTVLVERMMGIEPTRSAWKAEVLPLNYIRISQLQVILYHREENLSMINLLTTIIIILLKVNNYSILEYKK